MTFNCALFSFISKMLMINIIYRELGQLWLTIELLLRLNLDFTITGILINKLLFTVLSFLPQDTVNTPIKRPSIFIFRQDVP